MSSNSAVYANPQARSYSLPTPLETSQRSKLHQQLPDFTSTPLKALPDNAATHKVRAVFVKEEGTRAGLPAYKILGASWATFRAICEDNDLRLDSSLEEVGSMARHRGYTLFAATAGNHGRALARTAKIMGISCQIYVDSTVGSKKVDYIRGEGATVTVVEGGVDNALKRAANDCRSTLDGLHIQDFALDSPYSTVPKWHVEGYGALFEELEKQLQSEQLELTHLVVPVGGGTLCHAAVEFSKSKGRAIRVLAVEPEASPCLQRSLRAGRNLKISEGKTVMGGMVSPMVSLISWPILRKGVDASVVITEADSVTAAEQLHSHCVDAGPCGAGSFAGFQKVAETEPAAFCLTPESVVVILSTDGQSKDQSV